MHVLTKIFIVLVSLLAVMLVPLVVVYAHNENSYKSRLVAAESAAATANMSRDAAVARATSEAARFNSEISGYRDQIASLDQDKAAADASVRQLESQIATSNAATAEINSRIEIIVTTLKAGQELTESLVTELRELRAMAVTLETQKVQLDEALRDVTTQLDVAEQARRALAEELARLKQEHAGTMGDLGKAIALGFNPRSDARTGAVSARDRGINPDKSLTANIISIRRSPNNQNLAEIDAGQRDGVKKDWIMTIGGEGGRFVGNLRIINVDVNRATGMITLEQGANAVKVGQKVFAIPAD